MFMDQINHMTEQEKAAARADVDFYLSSSAVDADEIIKALDTCYLGDLINIQMLKADFCRITGRPVLYFTADDYRRIGVKSPEAAQRKELAKVLAEKLLRGYKKNGK